MLSLFRMGKRRNEFLFLPPLLHARLETLHVSYNWGAMTDPLLDSINLPSLKHLYYRDGDFCTRRIDSTIELLNRSGCSLKSFSLADIDDITEDMH